MLRCSAETIPEVTVPDSPSGLPIASTVSHRQPPVVLDGPAGSPSAYRVNEPDRLLRVWGMLSAASADLRTVTLPPTAMARLQRQLKAAIAELELAVSPALAGELDYLTHQNDATLGTASELRVDYASLLGWTSGLVIAMLDQIGKGNLEGIGRDSATGEVNMPIQVELCGPCGLIW